MTAPAARARTARPPPGLLTTNVQGLTDGGDIDEASEQADVDEMNDDAADQNEVVAPVPPKTVVKVKSADEAVDQDDQGENDNANDDDQGQDQQADQNSGGGD